MNSIDKLERNLNENPVKNAGFLSRMSFWWVRKTFATGYKRPLKETDVFQCLDEHKSTNIHKLFKDLWETEKQRPDPSILRLFWRAYGPKVFFWGVLFTITETMSRASLPQLIGGLLMYFTPGSGVTLDDAYQFALGIVLCSLIPVMTFHPFNLWNIQTAMKVRVGSCCLLYEKMLKLTKSSNIDGLSGRVINLMTNDVGKIDLALANYYDLWKGPLQAFLFGYFIYRELGMAGMLGIVFMMCFIPLQSCIGKKAATYRMDAAKKTDTRMKFMNEIIQGIQVIKMYTWENSFAEMIKNIRREEVVAIKGGQYVRAALWSLLMVSRVSVFLSVVCYVLTGNSITARKVFVSAAYYSYLNDSMVKCWPLSIASCSEAYTSTRRILEFLLIREDKHEILQKPGKTVSDEIPLQRKIHDPLAKNKRISLQNATADWIVEGQTTFGIRSINIEIESKELCVIIGPVGSGKSTLLHVLLGELELDSGFLHVDGRVSYAPQEPWLFEGTIRQNITFIDEFEEERYRKIVKVCALERDLEILPYGDETIVGERGTRLSGGQKARISLARAIYKRADIYLLDDPLSAVDAHVGRHIFDHCIKEFLAEKICVLVTHQLQYLRDVNHIVLMNDARIEAQGTYKHLKERKPLLLDDVPQENKEPVEETKTASPKKINGTCKEVEEFSAVGAVGFGVYRKYFKAVNNRFLTIAIIFLNIAVQTCYSSVDYFVSRWTNWEESVGKSIASEIYNSDALSPINTEKSDYTEQRTQYIIFYSIFMTVLVTCSVTRTFSFFYVCLRISKNLHDKMFRAITRAAMHFFNTNPSGRLLNKFSKDIGNVDSVLPVAFLEVIIFLMEVCAVLILVIVINPLLVVPTAVLVTITYFLRSIYVSTSRCVRRIESISRSPIFSHVNSTLNGLSTIRAFNAKDIVMDEFGKIQDFNSSSFYLFHCTSHAFAVWLDFFCVLYNACVVYSFLLLFPKNGGSGSVGLATTQSITLIALLQWGLRQTAELENQMVSVERIQEYVDLPSEPAMDTPEANKPGTEWPEKGKIEFKNLNLRYSEDGERILKDLKFTIEPQEKVGIVGRTGAGKSSIIQALFRLCPIEGSIEIDGVDTLKLGLKDLRSKISIIPQDPILFGGTLRSNLDPFNTCSDTDIWAALEQVELKNEVKSLIGGLDCRISDAGSNFSMGQRQLVCLARAILRNNRILILDEATANVDAETDSFIQKTIRTKFSHCTVLTIAHRLHTVMDSDKILVMEAGHVVEYGAPKELLEQENGVLKRLVDKTGLITEKECWVTRL